MVVPLAQLSFDFCLFFPFVFVFSFTCRHDWLPWLFIHMRSSMWQQTPDTEVSGVCCHIFKATLNKNIFFLTNQTKLICVTETSNSNGLLFFVSLIRNRWSCALCDCYLNKRNSPWETLISISSMSLLKICTSNPNKIIS